MAKRIKKALNWLLNNPLLFFKHLLVQIKKTLFSPKSLILKKVNGVLFEFDFNYDSVIKSMYIGGYELDTVEVMRRILRKGDTFIDVGANIGYLSSIAAGLVGQGGQVHSFEPVPEYFKKLKKMADMNPNYKITANQCAMGEESGKAVIRMSNEKNIGWNTMVFLSEKKEKIKEEFEVSVCRADNYIKDKSLDKISLIKIDVEGFEFAVLRGMSGYFEKTAFRPAIICEINPFACQLMGYTLSQLFEYMKKFSYDARSLVNSKIKVDINDLKETTDVVFLPS